MKISGTISVALLVLLAATVKAGTVVEDNYCFDNVLADCASGKQKISCTTNYGNFDDVSCLWNNLLNRYLTASFEYLLISTNFDNFELARPGFAGIFDQNSDNKWDTAVRILRYINQRHGVVKIGPSDARPCHNYQLYEIESLAKAVDIEKELAIHVNKIHQIASSPSPDKHDMEVCSKTARKYAFQQSGILRQFVGYETELTKMSDSANLAISLNIMDDVLQNESV